MSSRSGPGSASSLPFFGIPAQSGGSIVQGDGLVYTYNIVFAASLAAAAVSTVTQQFDQTTVFKWTKTTIYADLAGAAQTESGRVLPLVTMRITDVGTGFSFSNSAVPVFTMAGAGELPFILPTPQFIVANAVLQFAATNISAGTTYTALQMQMHGFKIYNYKQGF
jgi:hypothetical protein